MIDTLSKMDVVMKVRRTLLYFIGALAYLLTFGYSVSPHLIWGYR